MKLLKKIHEKESGQALILVVILMLSGGLIIGPLLGYMSTGLIVGQTHERLMERLYAADSGVEDALHKMVTGNALLPESGRVMDL